MQYSCHSWRHLYPTAGKQLDLAADDIDTMGRWQQGAGMSALYDSRACVSELIQKDKVMSAVSSGWQLVEPGCVAAKPPPPATSRPPPHSTRRPCRPQQPSCFVLNTRRSTLHGYGSGVYPFCGQWRCGDQKEPEIDALFVDSDQACLLHFEVCRSCASHRGCVFPSPQHPATAPASSTTLPKVLKSPEEVHRQVPRRHR